MLAVVKDGSHHPPIFLERHRFCLDQLEPAVVAVHESDRIDAGEYIQQLKPCARREGQALFPKRSERSLASKGSRLIAVDGNDPGRAKLGFLRVVMTLPHRGRGGSMRRSMIAQTALGRLATCEVPSGRGVRPHRALCSMPGVQHAIV